jgi:hypothetical protein
MPPGQRTRLAAIALALIISGHAGCAPAAQERNMTDYRHNPSPRQGWTLTMRIDDAPGPFASMRALEQYDVVNTECLPPPKDNPGGHTSPVPTEDVEIPLTRVSENEYVGTVYADRMLDEDYHGRGVCRWKLVQARVHMKATGAEGETLFIPSISEQQIVSGATEKAYFLRRFYPSAEMDGYVDTGVSDRSKMNPDLRDEDLFTATFIPGKEAP